MPLLRKRAVACLPMTLIGDRLFAERGPATKFALTASQAYGNGVVRLTYTPGASGP